MRPVEKAKVGDILVYHNTNDEDVELEVLRDYDNYGDAKNPLMANLGRYCSYCENDKDEEDLSVEHVSAKSKGGSESAWKNFLLCCKVCNSVKSVKEIDADNCHLPHINNTFLSLRYEKGGRVMVNDKLTGVSLEKASELYETLKLGRYPQTNECPTGRDSRWKNRLEVWNEAEDLKKKYELSQLSTDVIVERAKEKGCWSVWFTVFKGCDELRKALIKGFDGTCASCFDAANHYEPVERNPGREDPV